MARVVAFGVFVGLAASLATTACDGNQRPAALSPEDAFYQELQARVCAAEAACCAPAGFQPGACDDEVEASRPYGSPELGESFNAAAAVPCLARIQATKLSSPSFCAAETTTARALIAACDNLYAGGQYHTTPLGGACEVTPPTHSFFTSADSDRCAPPSGGVAGCVTWTTESGAGTTQWSGCVAQVALGDAGDSCCSPEDSVQECFYPDIPVGAPPATWRVSLRCGPGLYCDSDRICAVPLGLGAPCDMSSVPDDYRNYGPCAAGLFCNSPSSVGECAPLPLAGEPCAYDRGCAPGDQCSSAGICELVLAAGDPCGAGSLCGEGLQCRAAACQPLAAVGASCDDQRACVAGAFCRGGTCAAPLGEGEACAGGDQCASTTCKQGTCTAPPASTLPQPPPGCTG